jgi:hypothetical protein
MIVVFEEEGAGAGEDEGAGSVTVVSVVPPLPFEGFPNGY